MPKKKTKAEELMESTETTESIETAEQADAQEQTDDPELKTEDESIPPEAEENFGLTNEDSGDGEGTADDIPEPDMEHAPDFWSDALEVSVAEETAAENDTADVLAMLAPEPPKDDPLTPGNPDPPPTAANTAAEETAAIPQSDTDTTSRETERVPTRPGLMAEGAERRAFFNLDFHELDRNLNLVDGVTVMCNYSFQFEDGDFDMGDRVTVVIQR